MVLFKKAKWSTVCSEINVAMYLMLIKLVKENLEISLDMELTFGKKMIINTLGILKMDNFLDKETITGLQTKIINST